MDIYYQQNALPSLLQLAHSWRAGGWRPCFRIAGSVLFPMADTEPHSLRCWECFVHPPTAGGALGHHCSSLAGACCPSLYCVGRSQGYCALGQCPLPAPSAAHGDRATDGVGTPPFVGTDTISRGAETAKPVGGSAAGKFKCHRILFFKAGFFQHSFIGNFSSAIDISLGDTSSLVKTSTS